MILIIYNPVAGQKNPNELNKIKSLLDEQQKTYEVLVTSDKFSIAQYYERTRRLYDLVIVSGGDGTISQVVNAMMRTNSLSPLCLYPSGSTNEYATSLGITKKTLKKVLTEQVDTLKIDLGYHKGKGYFVYSLSFGNYTHLTYQTPQMLKNIFGKIAYGLYGFFSLYFVRLRKYKLTIQIDEKKITDNFIFGSLSNTKTLGMIINHPDVQVSDGKYEVFLVYTPKRVMDLNDIVQGLITRNYENPHFLVTQASCVTFQSPTAYAYNMDGELAGNYDHVDIEILKQKLTIYK